MKNMMLEVATQYRKPLLKFRETAFKNIESTHEEKDFNNLMFQVMNLAFWLRADLELLLRVAYWQDLPEDDFGARFLADQINFYEVTLERMAIDETKTIAFLDDLRKKAKKKKTPPIKPESNSIILKQLGYRKVELNKLFGCFHKALSKVSHPDPFFMCFPEDYRHQIEDNLMNIFKLCRKQLDSEWSLLIKHLEGAL